MNILQLISSGGFFGAENVLVTLSSELKKTEGFNVIGGVIRNQHNPHIEVAEECSRREIISQIFPCKGKIDFHAIRLIRKFIKKNNIQIVHSHGYKSNLLSRCATLGLSVGNVATCHNWLGDDSKMKFYAALDRLILKGFDSIITVSDEVSQKVLESGISARKVRSIRNGLDLDIFCATKEYRNIREGLQIPVKNKVIGTVGRLSQEKGHRLLLDVGNRIIKQYPDVTFLIIGDGPLRGELQKEFNSSPFIFTGLRNDLPALYSIMDIFVLPSLTEGLPMVLLEAMASRLPVIASRVGSIPDVIQDKKTGFLVSPGGSEEIKKAILYCIENYEEAKDIGNKGFERVNANFSSAQMAREYAKVYHAIH